MELDDGAAEKIEIGEMDMDVAMKQEMTEPVEKEAAQSFFILFFK